MTKFGDSIGNQLWEAINDCFDVMPVAATVDDRVSPTVKPVLSGHSKRRPKLVFKTNCHLMQDKSIAECSNGSILQYF